VQFEPSGNRLATSAADGTARLWDARPDTGGVLGKREEQEARVQFTADGMWGVFLTGRGDGPWKAEIWNVDTGTLLSETPLNQCTVSGPAMSEGGRNVASACRNTVTVWSPANGHVLRIGDHTEQFEEIALSARARASISSAGSRRGGIPSS
jgi:WD40 repeat protein